MSDTRANASQPAGQSEGDGATIPATGSVPVVRWQELGGLIRAKREAECLTQEEASRQSGVSPATLSRLERQARGLSQRVEPARPDTRTLERAALWLGVSLELVEAEVPGSLIQHSSLRERSPTVDIVTAHLRADPKLKPETAEALARAFQLIYDQFAESPPEDEGEGQSGE